MADARTFPQQDVFLNQVGIPHRLQDVCANDDKRQPHCRLLVHGHSLRVDSLEEVSPFTSISQAAEAAAEPRQQGDNRC